MCAAGCPPSNCLSDRSPARMQADTHSIGYQVINSTSCGAVHFSNVTQDFFNYQYATYARSVLLFDWVVVPVITLGAPPPMMPGSLHSAGLICCPWMTCISLSGRCLTIPLSVLLQRLPEPVQHDRQL